jgi:serine/threonine-protein kinase HipA
MSTVAEVRLWGSTIGAVVLEDGQQTATFEYAGDFVGSGIEVAPLMMPLLNLVYSFPALAQETFHGLSGLLADSLPDRFGNALIDAWLAGQGRSPGSFNAVERLCYTGLRGMGALEFVPAIGPKPDRGKQLAVERLVALASEVLTHRDSLQTHFTTKSQSRAMADILRVGTSAGGARAKAVIAWNRHTNEVRCGQVDADAGFEHWLIKFDGVSSNRDKELDDPKGFGAIEYAYSRMAAECGIVMSECRLLEEGGRRHFMTRRFDRTDGRGKLHMQSLGAMAHLDYNQPGVHSYEQAFDVIRRLGLSADSTEQMFRRMVFNIVGRNQDDHVKNIAFLMDRQGKWSLAPAFDVTYSYQPDGQWTSSHQMTLHGKREHFTMEDFIACGKAALLKHGQAKAIVNQTCKVVSQWPKYAEQAGVLSEHINKIQNALRLEIIG